MNKENMTEKIVSAALALFYEQGFHATGVDLLSQQAGVTKKTLYRYFAGKDELIGAALALRHRQFMQQMRAFVEARQTGRRPLEYIEFIISWAQERDFHGCAFINATAEYGQQTNAIHRQAADHKHAVLAQLSQWCADAGVAQPPALARSLFLIGEGTIVASQTQGPDEAAFAAARQMAQQLWQAARTDGETR
ncbi:TetR/AcrR family transcriptional regulator [Affinibrenneria salicis]|uniref:TetR/AcrR family transcriptional regulator n=1 Tax=Affinibrenneria salicis TaxID=2590031 RepID=A0A5J5FYM0_9GAMM|nr:TetR/AcrR family transcriptional regulator [Affinibrenneria salicis]KAA8999301.1 TetR/AcrR family transcriptional regulator [Affinibrenneria salicis]